MTAIQLVNKQHCLPLAALPSAVWLAREYVNRSLKGYGLSHLTDTASVLSSELVTNAVKAVGVLERNIDWRVIWPKLHTIAVCCYHSAGYVVIEVWDDDPHPPVIKQATEEDEGGRGLLLVEALAERWGYRWPKVGGKIVWCAFK